MGHIFFTMNDLINNSQTVYRAGNNQFFSEIYSKLHKCLVEHSKPLSIFDHPVEHPYVCVRQMLIPNQNNLNVFEFFLFLIYADLLKTLPQFAGLFHPKTSCTPFPIILLEYAISSRPSPSETILYSCSRFPVQLAFCSSTPVLSSLALRTAVICKQLAKSIVT